MLPFCWGWSRWSPELRCYACACTDTDTYTHIELIFSLSLCLSTDEWYGAGVEYRVLADQTGGGAQREVSPALRADRHLQWRFGGDLRQGGKSGTTVSAELLAGVPGPRILAIETATQQNVTVSNSSCLKLQNEHSNSSLLDLCHCMCMHIRTCTMSYIGFGMSAVAGRDGLVSMEMTVVCPIDFMLACPDIALACPKDFILV